MDNLNQILLVGRLGQTPEIKYFESGAVLTKVSLAVNRHRRDEVPDWFSLEFWDKQAEVAANYCAQGSLIGVTGSLKLDEWTDRQTGEMRSKPVVRVNSVELLSSSRDKQQATESPEGDF